MKNFKRMLGFAVTSASLFASGAALAEDPDRPAVTVTAGGGVEDFFADGMRETSDPSGLWSVRAAVELQRYVAVEAGYVGTAAQVNAPIGSTEATLVGTGLEAIARATPLPSAMIRPYAFVGAGWRHYDVSGEDFTTSDSGMSDSADVLQIPMGAGLDYRYGEFIADARFTFRPSTGTELVAYRDGSEASLNTWGVSAGLGYEF